MICNWMMHNFKIDIKLKNPCFSLSLGAGDNLTLVINSNIDCNFSESNNMVTVGDAGRTASASDSRMDWPASASDSRVNQPTSASDSRVNQPTSASDSRVNQPTSASDSRVNQPTSASDSRVNQPTSASDSRVNQPAASDSRKDQPASASHASDEGSTTNDNLEDLLREAEEFEIIAEEEVTEAGMTSTAEALKYLAGCIASKSTDASLRSSDSSIPERSSKSTYVGRLQDKDFACPRKNG